MTQPLGALRRISRDRPAPRVAGERCEMCAQPVPGAHGHVVHLEGRALMCTCRACYLLFSGDGDQRYRAVPDRYLSFPNVSADGPAFDALDIPVGLVFLFYNSVQDRLVGFYPGPAGATESELPLDAWAGVLAAHPELATLRPDVEALLVRRTTPGAAHSGSCHLVPIDVCYELVGTLRQGWRGFDGGTEARAAVADFFTRVQERSVDG
ncbi:DUF5947 family protein [Asanoa iriomotensis]|uniref:Uncharacterized protein n=1 Tax=Asanoa iriomotensis TaxID=234613 RepID=A0ABQ4C1S7_9ACTN|nr:DUF5947 family protein [Asanoa iriomotensis]GIF56738.1 hypothetical protein Air01nite_28330 [Asanoa iriomotensis]